MIISNLPNDLIEEILFRIPATSLKQLRFTCKQWNTLLNDTKFTEKHFDKAPTDFPFLMLKGSTLYSININHHDVSNKLFVDPATKVSYDITLINSFANLGRVYILKYFYCNGLLLFTTKDNRLVVWNPCTSQIRWIKPNIHLEENICFALGYVKNKSFYSYKILSYCDNKNVVFDITESEDRVVVLGIYEFSSHSWKVIDGVTFEFFLRTNGVSLMGNIYWVSCNDVLVFDFKIQRFRCLNLPDQHFTRGFMTLSSLNDDKLIISYQSLRKLETEIWVSKIIHNDETKFLPWRKFLEIGPLSDIGYLHSNFIDEKNKFAVSSIIKPSGDGTFYIFGDGDDKQIEIPFEEESLFKSSCKFFPFIYIPSLVQI